MLTASNNSTATPPPNDNDGLNPTSNNNHENNNNEEKVSSLHDNEEEEDAVKPFTAFLGDSLPRTYIAFVHRPEYVSEHPKRIASTRKPTLGECRAAFENKEALQKLLEELLSENGHIGNIKEWLLFLFCALDAEETKLQRSQVEQHEWCESHLEYLIESAPQKVCPVAFQVGDIVWNCETCQRDSTCVQCQKCFQTSNHEGHEVFFYQVGVTGGGCCDCGDFDAWDAAGCCPQHGTIASIESFPATIRTACSEVTSYLALWLTDACMQIATQKLNQSTQQYFSVTYRTEYRDLFDEVFRDLPPSKIPFAVTVEDGNERLLAIPVSYLEEIERCCEEILNLDDKNVVSITFDDPTFRLAQRVAVVVDSLNSLCRTSDSLVRILVDSLTLTQRSTSSDGMETWTVQLPNHPLTLKERALEAKGRKDEIEFLPSGLLEDLIVSDPTLPEILSNSLHMFYMRLLTDLEFKERYAIAFARTFLLTMKKAVRATKESQIPYVDFGIFGLSVQFLNRTKFVDVLIRDYDFFADLFSALNFVLEFGVKKDYNGKNIYDASCPPIKQRMYRYALADLRYTLQIPGISRYFCFENSSALKAWLSILAMVQAMDPIQRILPPAEALLHEDENWAHATFLSMNLSMIYPYLLRSLILEEKTDAEFSKQPEFFDQLLTFCHQFEDHIQASWNTVQRVLERHKVSFYYPLFRFTSLSISFAGCACLTATRSEEKSMHILKSISLDSISKMAKASFRLLAASSQIKALMWRRNGVGPSNRNVNYDRGLSVFLTRDLDIRSIQLAGLQMEAHEILRMGLQAFELTTAFNDPPTTEPKCDEEYLPAMTELFFECLISIITEIPMCSTSSDVTPREVFDQEFRRLLIHRLTEAPQAFTPISEVATLMSFNSDITKIGDDDVKRILDQISYAKQSPDGMAATTFELIDEVWDEYDPTYYHQVREARERARERWLEARNRSSKKQNRILPACPPFPPYAHPGFLPFRNALLLEVFPLAATCFKRAKRATLDADAQVQTSWASTVTFVSLQLMTLAVHAKLDSVIWFSDNELLDTMVEVAERSLSPPFDSIVQDGVKWIIQEVSKINPEFEKLIKSKLTNSEAEVTSKADVQGNPKRNKRVRAQEKAMAAMKAAAMSFGETLGGEIDDDDELSNTKVKQADTEETKHRDHDPVCCICLEKDSSSQLSTLGFLQKSSVLFENDASRILSWQSDITVVTQCGHAMHTSCYSTWWKSIEVQYPHEFMASNEDRRNGEFLCPLCKTVCNTLVPYNSHCNAFFWERSSDFEDDSTQTFASDFNFFPTSFLLQDPPLKDDLDPDDTTTATVVNSLKDLEKDVVNFFHLSVLGGDQSELLKHILTFWNSQICAILSNPSSSDSVAKAKFGIQSALSIASVVPIKDLFENIEGFTETNASLASTSPELFAGVSFLAMLLLRCTDTVFEVFEAQQFQEERIFMQALGLKIFQSLLDPFDDDESDSFRAPWDTDKTLPPIVCSSFCSEFLSQPVQAEEITFLEGLQDSLLKVVRDVYVEENSVQKWIDLEHWKRGEDLVLMVRKQVSPLLELCNALASASNFRVIFSSRNMQPFFKLFQQKELEMFSNSLVSSSSLEMKTFIKSKALTRSLQLVLGESLTRPPFHPMRIRQFVTLPNEYTQLYAFSQIGTPCSRCQKAVHEKAVCLICGELLPAAADCFRQGLAGGPCTIHCITNHDGIGVFFLLHRSAILYMNRLKSALWSSLYVDKNGEERSGPQRGLPLRLDARRMAKVQEVFSKHGIPHIVSTLRGTNPDGFIKDGLF